MTKPNHKNLDKLYEAAFLQSANYAYLLDEDGHLINCNHQLMNKLGLDAIKDHSVGAMYQLMLQHHFGNQHQILDHKKADIAALVDDVTESDNKPVPFWLNQEKTHMFQVLRTPIKNENDKQHGLLVEMIDVTERLYLSEQLEKIRQELMRKNAKVEDSLTFSTHVTPPDADVLLAESPLVLLVEDDAMAQKAAKSVLMHFDFEVDIASNEEEFKMLFEPGKYQLVLMDIGLGDTSGYMLAKQLRKTEQGTDFCVPVIAVTGYDPVHLVGDCAHYKMEGAIQKPLTVEQVSQLNQRYIKNIDIDIKGLEPAKPFS